MSDMSKLKQSILEVGKITEKDVDALRTLLIEMNDVTEEMVDVLIELNDKTNEKDNVAEWKTLFVDGVRAYAIKGDHLDEERGVHLVDKFSEAKVNASERAVLLNIVANVPKTSLGFQRYVLMAFKDAALADGDINEEEVNDIRTIIYGQGGVLSGAVSRFEADWLFDINDAVTNVRNHPSWKDLMIEAITGHLLGNEEEPDEISEDEAGWLVDRIERSGRYDEVEQAIVSTIKETATQIPEILYKL